jgi:uncharacterized protein (DUF1697 family)
MARRCSRIRREIHTSIKNALDSGCGGLRGSTLAAMSKRKGTGVATFIAFLRAVNVAGHAVVKMDALREACTAAGCCNVRTYIQSGNIVFDSSAGEPTILRKLREALRSLLGKEPGIFLRTLDEMAQLVARDPFREFMSEQNTKFYVAFLAEPPAVKPKFPLLLPKEGLEAFGMSGREVFILSRPISSGSHGFSNAFVEKQFKLSATTRNWNTIVKIVKFAQSEHPNC